MAQGLWEKNLWSSLDFEIRLLSFYSFDTLNSQWSALIPSVRTLIFRANLWLWIKLWKAMWPQLHSSTNSSASSRVWICSCLIELDRIGQANLTNWSSSHMAGKLFLIKWTTETRFLNKIIHSNRHQLLWEWRNHGLLHAYNYDLSDTNYNYKWNNISIAAISWYLIIFHECCCNIKLKLETEPCNNRLKWRGCLLPE